MSVELGSKGGSGEYLVAPDELPPMIDRSRHGEREPSSREGLLGFVHEAIRITRRIARSKTRVAQLAIGMTFQKNIPENTEISTGMNDDTSDVARMLHASVFLQRGYIHEGDLNENGLVASTLDPYVNHSKYTVLTNKGNDIPKVAARKIQYKKEKGLNSFLSFNGASFYPEVVERIKDIGPDNVVEVSSLVKGEGVDTLDVMYLIRQMWQEALDDDEKLWIFVFNTKVYNSIAEKLVGLVEQAGPETHLEAYGADVVPCVISPKGAIGGYLTKYEEASFAQKRIMAVFAKFMLHDINSDALTGEQKEQFARFGII